MTLYVKHLALTGGEGSCSYHSGTGNCVGCGLGGGGEEEEEEKEEEEE